MKRLVGISSTALLLTATLMLSAGCSRSAPVLRGSEVVFKVTRVGSVDLRVELARGQDAKDIHAEGWYLSPAHMSRIFELLGKRESAK